MDHITAGSRHSGITVEIDKSPIIVVKQTSNVYAPWVKDDAVKVTQSVKIEIKY